MSDRKSMHNFIDKCDIYFEDALISKELLIKTYADFIASSFSERDRTMGVVLNTGSICFDIVSILSAVFGNLLLDGSDCDTVISSLTEGDMVQYKNSRYFWDGFVKSEGQKYLPVSDIENATHISLIQKVSDKHLGENPITTRILLEKKNLIIPYNGVSEITDGRGLHKLDINRADFITYLFDIPKSEIPSVSGVSTVIVAEKYIADRIIKGITIFYDDNKSVSLLDIVTISYFTEAGEYRYAGNPGKNDAALKIVGKISVARDLILNKRANNAVGLFVLDPYSLIKGRSELPDLLNRKSLRYIYLSANIDFVNTEDVINACEIDTIALFACTKEFLLLHSKPLNIKNRFTELLDKQVDNIENKEIQSVIVYGGCTWEEYRSAKESLYRLRKFDWNDENKDLFILKAYSLLNLFTTAVFPIGKLEEMIRDGLLNGRVISPRQRIDGLLELADKLPASFLDKVLEIIALLERLYNEEKTGCPKYNKLLEVIGSESAENIAVLVPKAYYSDVLMADKSLTGKNLTVVTANRFDNSVFYDKIIVVGDFSGKRFDTFKCCAASNIVVLLYDYESHVFKRKETAARLFEHELDKRTGTVAEDFEDLKEFSGGNTLSETDEEIQAVNAMTEELNCYIDKIGEFDVRSLIGQISETGTTATAEIVKVGTFSDGERILFSKYYKAFVFNKIADTVIETDVEKLVQGDILVFTRNDNFTKNMVDNIFDELLSSDRLSETIKDAAFKSEYWKLVLRGYMERNAFSYREISEKLSILGCRRHEVTIRTWLNEESRIIGPLDEEAFIQIGILTDDPDIKCNSKDFYEACRVVRHERREILSLVGRAIIDKLRGNLSERGGLLEAVYENVDKLAFTMELESVTELEKPVSVPINMINRPLNATEV